MRKEINNSYREHDPRIVYRGADPSRLDALTDAVFGIAITLLVFSIANPNSFSDLLDFAKTLPAFLLSVAFLILIWNEHASFSEIYTINDSLLVILNVFFVSLIIFMVYPLRFLSLFLTNLIFRTDIDISIQLHQIPWLMMYYGLAVFALYFCVFLFYWRVQKIKIKLDLNPFEIFHTRWQKKRLTILFSVPLLSVMFAIIFRGLHPMWSAFISGMIYWLYFPLMWWWMKKFEDKQMRLR
ncbi:MAG: DUF1211 domain-containing protein [Cyclobacteriaceae bacterium]|nr:DUF1211 domain-containing protein [Cyclobacteriaceae bacterium]